MKKKSKKILALIAVGFSVMCIGLIYGGFADRSFALPADHRITVNNQDPASISANGEALFEIKDQDGKIVAKVVATGGKEDSGQYRVEDGDVLKGTVAVEDGYGIKSSTPYIFDTDSECERSSFEDRIHNNVNLEIEIRKKYGVTIKDAKRVEKLFGVEYILNSKQATVTLSGHPCYLEKKDPSQFESGDVYVHIYPKKGYYFKAAHVDNQKYTDSDINFIMPAKDVEIKDFDLGRDDIAPVVKGVASGQTYSVQDINDGGGIVMEDTESGIDYYKIYEKIGNDWIEKYYRGVPGSNATKVTTTIDKTQPPWNELKSSDIRISVCDSAGNETTVDFILSDIVGGSCQHDWSGAWTSVNESEHKKECARCSEEYLHDHEWDYRVVDNGARIIGQCKLCGHSSQSSSGNNIIDWANEYNAHIMRPLMEEFDEAYAAAEDAINEANAALQKALASGTVEDARIADEKAKTASALAGKASTILKTLEDSIEVANTILNESYAKLSNNPSTDPNLLAQLSNYLNHEQSEKNEFLFNESVQNVKTGNTQAQAQAVEQQASAHRKAIESPAIEKKANPMTAKGKTVKVSNKKLRKKTQSIKRTKAITLRNAQGTVTYKKVSVGSKKVNKKYGKKFIVNKKTGKITVKKGLKKGTYKVKIKVNAAGNANYYAATKTVTVKIRVK